jgi:uncharacterized DUF497 family protein
MSPDFIDWDDEDDPDGNIQHLALNGVTPEEAEEVLDDPNSRDDISRSTGRPIRLGWTTTGKFVAVVYTVLSKDPLIIRPITAYPPDDD